MEKFRSKVSMEKKNSTSVAGPEAKETLSLPTLSMLDDNETCRYAISDRNRARVIWNACLLVLLLYTGVVFPFKLAFIDFGIPERVLPEEYELIEFWVLDVGFFIDLVVNFFFSYRDTHGREIFDLGRIAKRYMRGGFIINFIACIPPEAFSWGLCSLIEGDTASCNTGSVNQVGRLSRLPRVSRLTRLARLTRLLKVQGILEGSTAWKTLSGFRPVRMINQCCALLFVVHIVACGWWIVASFHDNVGNTWVGRREPYNDGVSLLQLSNEYRISIREQWLTSMYYTLTIFTTVGFGDISAYTAGEMMYACFAMIVGCIVNGIILTEVIDIYSSVNDEVRQIQSRKNLVRSFGKHMQVGVKVSEMMARAMSKNVVEENSYNREDMRTVLTNGVLPRPLLNILPGTLFGGRLIKNKFVSGALLPGMGTMPPRFPLLLGLSCSSFYYESQQVVYHIQDHAWNIYLVMAGIFSYVATGPEDFDLSREITKTWAKTLAGVTSGQMESVHTDDSSPYQLFGAQQYFGDLELLHSPGPRVATARCESKQEGHVLVFHKRDLFALLEEFPIMRKGWQDLAKHRARRTAAAQGRLRPCTYKELAVYNMQRGIRYILMRREGRLSLKDFRGETANRDRRRSRRRSSLGRLIAEAVPEYAHDMQQQIDELHTDMHELHADMRCVKETLCEIKTLIESPPSRRPAPLGIPASQPSRIPAPPGIPPPPEMVEM